MNYSYKRKYFSSPQASKKLAISSIWMLVLLAVVLLFAPFFKTMFKTLFKKSSDDETKKKQKEYVSDVAESIDESNLTISSVEARGIALKIKQSLEGGSTDEIMFFEAIGKNFKKDLTSAQFETNKNAGHTTLELDTATSYVMSTSILSYFYNGKTKCSFTPYTDDDYRLIYSEFGLKKYGWIWTDETELGEWIRGDFSGDLLEKALSPFINAGIIM